MIKQAFRWWLLSVLSLLPAATMAQADAVNLTYHKGQMPRAPDAIKAYGPDLFGDRINLYDGSFSFEQTDVSLSGNSDLPVAVSRKWTARAWAVRGAMADWDLETPRIHGTFADPEGFVPWGGSAATRCSGFGAPAGVTRGTSIELESGGPSVQDISSFEYWGGTYVTVPGVGSQEILKRAAGNALKPADGGSYPLVTPQNWQIGCLSSLKNAVGQGFTAVLPDGTRYRFDWYATRRQTTMNLGDAQLARKDHFIMATEVTDRFGNWVRYTYDPTNPMNLTRIEANDGRVITLGYSDGRVSSVFDRTRTWYYQYASSGDLQSVVLPDQSRWSFDMRPMVYPNNLTSESGPGCDLLGDVPGGIYIGRMTHPSGANGTFTSHFAAHGRTNVTRSCPTIPGTVWEDSPIWPKSLVTQTLTKKEVTGPGVLPMVWQYIVGIGNDPWGAWAPCAGCTSSKVTAVTEPDGSVTRHTFGIRWRENEGQLLKLEQGAASLAGPALRTTTFTYRNAVAGQCPLDRWGDSELFTGDYLSSRNRPQDSRVTYQQGVSFSWLVDLGPQGFDCFAKPARFTQASSLGFSRQTQTTYENNLPKWVLGQVKQITDLGSGRVPQAYEYDSLTAQPIRSYAFGLLNSRFGYHGDGTLYTVANAVNPPTVLTDYWLGVPRNVAFADGTSQRATVNNMGFVTSHTNEENSTTSYTYDAMGRVASIHYPGGYTPTFQTFVQAPTAGYGLAAGHWRQTVQTGAGYRHRYFDALWRLRLEHVYDNSNIGATQRFVETRYGSSGGKSFESYPSRSLTLPGQAMVVDQAIAGKSTAYDGLNRVISHRADSELGPLVTFTEYLDGFRRRVTNPRGFATTHSFQAFDAPSEDVIAHVGMADGTSLAIARDVFHKPSTITRGGSYFDPALSAYVTQQLTRSYRYDQFERLCKTVEPETGATVQGYNGAGNLAWKASGQPFVSTTPCEDSGVPESSRVRFGYDVRDRLESTTYGDGSAGVTRNYWRDGLLKQIKSGDVLWTYHYDERRLLTHEEYTWWANATPGAGWNLRWVYNTNGHIQSLTDPWGLMNYAPDGLGRPTQISGYASNVTYHPNGVVAGYTLNNGTVHSLSQNIRGLPEVMRDIGVTHDVYSYDANGNVSGIVDRQSADVLAGTATRSMGYDTLDRLTMANGTWGAGTFAYDAVDNLRSSTVGGRTLWHNFGDATNRLTSLSGSQSVAVIYNVNGNVVQRGNQTFAFDIGNRLRSAPGKANSYVYDGHGRRSQANLTNGDWHLHAYAMDGKLRFSFRGYQGHTRYVYLGDKLISETTEAATTFSHTDALGSPVAITNSIGAVQSRTRYEPYGATAAGTNPAKIGFTGHVNDGDTGLVYMQQRYYEPIAGRFLSVDPVTTDAATGSSFNRYVYGNNNPYKFKDPDGRFAQFALLATPPGLAVAAVAVVGHYLLPGREAREQSLGNLIRSESSGGGKPSTLTPGPNAGDSIPARGPGRDFTPGERQQVNDIGNATGCHTCGAKSPGTKENWIPDHQPPNSQNPDGGPQRLYPHCLSCSRTQGGEANAEKARGGKAEEPKREEPKTAK